MQKKNKTREQCETREIQTITDPELGHIVTLAPVQELEEPTTPDPIKEIAEHQANEDIPTHHTPLPEHLTTRVESDYVQALMRQPESAAASSGPLLTTKVNGQDIATMLEQNLQGHQTTELDAEKVASLVQDMTVEKQQTTAKLKGKRVEELSNERPEQRTEQISDLELGVIADALKEHASQEKSSTHFNEVETRRWKAGEVAGIVSETDAAALLEMSSVREDDEALLDVPEKQTTQTVTQDELDTLMEEATAQRPRQGKKSEELPVKKPSPPIVPLFEERSPQYMTRSPEGNYRSVAPSEVDHAWHKSSSDDSSMTLTNKLLLVLVVLVVLLAVGNVLYLMWPKS